VLLLLTLGGGGGWYVRQQHLERQAEQARQETEQLRRQAELARSVEDDLNHLERARAARDWGVAWKVLDRLDGRLEQGGGDEFRERVRAARDGLTRLWRDQEMLGKLEAARLQAAAPGSDLVEGFDFEGGRRRLQEAFAWYGLDVLHEEPEQVARRIAASPLREDLVTALDGWSQLPGTPDAERLRALADLADTDPWRRQLREAVRKRDGSLVRQLAAQRPIAELTPANICFVAQGLRLVGAADRALAVLREGQRRHPADFWLNYDLACALAGASPPQRAEALRYYTAALALRPDSAVVHFQNGYLLHAEGKYAEAEAPFRDAVRLKPDYVLALTNLSNALGGQGKQAEAEAVLREAIRLKPDYAIAWLNLGFRLGAQGKLTEAADAYREAIGHKPDYALAWYNLGVCLADQGKLTEAVDAYREATRIKPDYESAHWNCGLLLKRLGRFPDAEAEIRAAIRLKPDAASLHYNLGIVLKEQRKFTEAEAAYRAAIRLNPNYAEAHCNLGGVLQNLGRFKEAADSYRRGHELGSGRSGWNFPSGEWLRRAERLAAVEARLPALLEGKDKPADASDGLDCAFVCAKKNLKAAAVRFCAETFAVNPALAEDRKAWHRYNAACYAALAAAGKDEGPKPPDEPERARLRAQALGWLRDDLAAWDRHLDGGKPQDRTLVEARMRHWQKDADLAGVRDTDALAKLPEAEGAEWRELWQDVEVLLKRAAESK
jgi:tetratricopeptide (TPR) repeat protein